MRRSELVTLLKGAVLNGGAPTTFVDELEGGGGQGWYRAWLRFELDFTLGTGSGAKTDEPELSIIKSITLRSDKNEYFVNAQSGRAMYDWARRKMRRAPRRDAFAAATAKYYVQIPLLFADDDLARPEDTIIDTGRYESMTLQIVMGSVSDLLTTVGTSTVAFRVWLVAERTTARLIESQLPIRYISYDSSPAIDLSAQTVVKLDRGDPNQAPADLQRVGWLGRKPVLRRAGQYHHRNRRDGGHDRVPRPRTGLRFAPGQERGGVRA